VSRLGVDRKSRSGRHLVDPTGELVAFCNEELPRLDPAVRLKSGSSAPNSENCAHKRAHFKDFHTQALSVAPPARDDLSSLSYVSFSYREVYHPHLRQGLISEGYRSTGTQHRARAFEHFEPRRFTKSSVGDEIAMSSDRERSVVMNC
jgi:hypothetical protein